MSSNKFELELEKVIEQENPEYYNGLKTILAQTNKKNIRLTLIFKIRFKSSQCDSIIKVLLLKFLQTECNILMRPTQKVIFLIRKFQN